MAVTEGLMQLWLKETVNSNSVLDVVRRMEKAYQLEERRETPTGPEGALLLWTASCCQALGHKITMDCDPGEVKLLPSIGTLTVMQHRNIPFSGIGIQRAEDH